MNFIVFNSISHEWAQLTREISSLPLEDKIHILFTYCLLYTSDAADE